MGSESEEEEGLNASMKPPLCQKWENEYQTASCGCLCGYSKSDSENASVTGVAQFCGLKINLGHYTTEKVGPRKPGHMPPRCTAAGWTFAVHQLLVNRSADLVLN